MAQARNRAPVAVYVPDFLANPMRLSFKFPRRVAKITEAQALNHSHLKIVGLVGSIDNDMSMTDLTIGAPTALHRICEAIDNINSTAFSHSRAFVLEVMGRHCGWLALLAGVAYVSELRICNIISNRMFGHHQRWCRLYFHPGTAPQRQTMGKRDVCLHSTCESIPLLQGSASLIRHVSTARLGNARPS
jgi:hypothetical protein